MPAAVAVVGLVIAAYGAYEQHGATKDAKKAAEENLGIQQQIAGENRQQIEAQQRIADIQNARSRAQLARESRITAANIEANGARGATVFSSGVQGAVGAARTAGASNVGGFDVAEANTRRITESQFRVAGLGADLGAAQRDMSFAQARGSEGQAYFNLGTSIFGAGGGYKTIFDTTKTK